MPAAYEGFKEVAVKIQGQSFFTNMGFETGDFTGWSHESHTWKKPAPGSYTPEKSAIVTQDDDYIAGPFISQVYLGNYSTRVNSGDDKWHISTISQTATVPDVINPIVEFYWAAVLEDPNHPSADQPYLNITVKDENTGYYLYQRHFYSNDPAYSGWISILDQYQSLWRCIAWQKVFFSLASAVGHDITINVEAADCGEGAHGGYVYVDGLD